MESFRKWFYRPKKDDKSLLAQFFFADEALNMIASELDSFDGRKDPERCTSLVNQLRQCQDKVLTITSAVMDVLIGDERANRDFRVKFPEDVLQENLAGQLWFGAECLAAGSSIMNREAESTEMRPLAKAVTRSLENVRNLLREACLRNNTPNGPIKLDNNELVTEMLLESLKIFDRLFAEFEFAYVSAMVPVKTTQEYELQELIGVLFSETLQRALKMKLLSQEMVDSCDPALMFTIPRLGIVSGLLVFPNGPLCIDKAYEEMSEMFRPFRVLLHRIRDLLWTLNKRELFMLEKLLCDNEQIGDVKTVGEFEVHRDWDDLIGRFYNDYPLCKDYISNFSSVTTPLGPKNVETDPITETTETPSTSGRTAHLKGKCVSQESLLDEDEDCLEAISVAAATLSTLLSEREIEREICEAAKAKKEVRSSESPDDSGVCTENTSLDRSPILDVNVELSGDTSPRVRAPPKVAVRKRPKFSVKTTDEDNSSIGSSDTSSFNSNCADDEEIALAMQAAEFASRNKVRAMYRSSEDLIHRLFVCIAGVADQLQTNFASDLRNILKAVFLMNASDSNETDTVISSSSLDVSIEYHPSENEVIENNEFSVDPNILAQEALFDTNVYFALEESGQNDDGTPNTHLEYSNHPRQTNGDATVSALAVDLNRYAAIQEESPERPPVWIPDVEAPRCMSCGANFTVVRRRHHCRNCGKVFCARCSSNSVPLPKFGHVKAVRVCNKCFMYHLTPFTM